MSDLADQARESEEQLADAVRRFGRAADVAPAAAGVCLNCGDPVSDARRWCSPECRDDWERRQERAPTRGNT